MLGDALTIETELKSCYLKEFGVGDFMWGAIS